MEQSPWSRRLPPGPPDKGTAAQPAQPPSSLPSRTGPLGPVDSPSVRRKVPEPAGIGRLAPNQSDSQARPFARRPQGRRFVAAALVLIGSALAGGVVVLFSSGNNEVQVVSETTALTSSTTSTVPQASSSSGANWDELARSIVFISVGAPCNWRGSGTLVLDGSFVLTNEHVVLDGRCSLTVGLTKDLSSEPSGSLNAVVLARSVDDDLAVLRLVDASGQPVSPTGHQPVEIDYQQPPLGAKLTTLGYPALGDFDAGLTITFTSGDFSGIDYTFGEFYKTTAQMRGGVSGGAAFADNGKLIGVPTAGLVDQETGEDVGINLIRPAKFARPLLEAAQKTPLTPVAIGDESSGSTGDDGAMSSNDPRFRTCKEAKSNGYGPYYVGIDPEYDWYIDGDSDGVVCE